MDARVPSKKVDENFKKWWAKFLRNGASPATAAAITRMNGQIDVRKILPSIKVPALIIHARGDQVITLDHGTYLSNMIPNARLVVVDTDNHIPWVGAPTQILAEVEEFVTGIKTERTIERILSTLLFTDIVDSSGLAQEMGDQQWTDLLEIHDSAIRHELLVHSGKEIDTAGDGFFASFDGPARALRCAKAIGEAIRELGLSITLGIHTGECEVWGSNLAGIAVRIASRICSMAEPNQILVSRTVKDLVAGSGIDFEEIGRVKLKGISNEWELFEVL